MKRSLLTLIFFSTTAAHATAVHDMAVDVGLGAGIPLASEWLKDHTDPSISGQAAVRWGLGEKFSLGVAYDAFAYGDSDLFDHSVSALGRFDFCADCRHGFFLKAGVGAANVMDFPGHPDDSYWTPAAQLGIGYSCHLTDNWALSLSTDMHHLRKKDQNRSEQNILRPLLGLTYLFGSPAVAQTTTQTVSTRQASTRPPRSDVKFAFNEANIVSGQSDQLDDLASVMKKNPGMTVTVEGHTDSIGSDQYNQALSELRARAVRNYLSTKHGIASSRVNAVGFGEKRPVAPNSTVTGRAKNRRATTGEVRYQELGATTLRNRR